MSLNYVMLVCNYILNSLKQKKKKLKKLKIMKLYIEQNYYVLDDNTLAELSLI